MAGPHPQRHSDQMVTRLPLAAHAGPAQPELRIRPGRPKFEIIIPAENGGQPLLRLFESNGFLDAEYDESRTTDAVQRFLHQMLQWSGQVGLAWKDAVLEAVEGSTP